MGNEQSSGAKSAAASLHLPGSKSVSNSTVNEHLRKAEKTGVLQLAKCSLKQVPAPLLQLSNLRSLDLSENKLEQLPAAIGSFKILKQLNLSHNRLGSLPDELGNLKKLEVLDVQHNRLTALPNTLVGLGALRSLLLAHNALTHFPVVLCDLLNLDSVDLSANRIEGLQDVPPERLGRLHVQELNLNENRLSGLSDGLALCPRLQVLRLQENCLPVHAFTEPILADSQLSLLVCDGNLFQNKQLLDMPGYELYNQRYTDVKKKMF